MKWLIGALVILVGAEQVFAAPEKRTVCVWDMLGQNGDVTNALKDFQLAVKNQVILDLKSYHQEHVAMADFEAGLCDAVLNSGRSLKSYNAFTSSIEAFYALPTKDHLSRAIQVLSHPKFASKMVTSKNNKVYEVAGIAPFAPIHAFVRQSNIMGRTDLTNVKVGMFTEDAIAVNLVSRYGGIGYPSDLSNMGERLASSQVDMVISPLSFYHGLRLNVGTKDGGVVQQPLAYLTAQLLIDQAKFPDGFGQFARRYFSQNIERYFLQLQNFERLIPEDKWLPLSPVVAKILEEESAKSRFDLVGKGVYDKQMLLLLKKIRCEKNALLPECVVPDAY